MAFELDHILTSAVFRPTMRTSGGETYFTVEVDGAFDVLYPGRLEKTKLAFFTHRLRLTDTGPEPVGTGDPDAPHPHHGSEPTHAGWQTVEKRIPLELRVFDPDGVEFTAEVVTVADLRKHRDLRGSAVGRWRYELRGESERFRLDDQGDELTGEHGTISLSLLETVASESAAPLVDRVALDGSRQSFQFDLFRVGTFTAEVTQTSSSDPWHGSMTLRAPDGKVVASTAARTLVHDVEVATLALSRDAAGHPRFWTLEVAPQGGVVVGSPRLTAQVIGGGRISTGTILERVTQMIGPPGHNFLRFYGENSDGFAKCRLVIDDVGAAETIDMHGLLDKQLKLIPQDPDFDVHFLDIRAGKPYTLFRTEESFDKELEGYQIPLRVDVGGLRVDNIEVTVGHAKRLEAEAALQGIVSGAPPKAIPGVTVTVEVAGEATVSIGSVSFATLTADGGAFELELGIDAVEGTPKLVTWVPDGAVDADVVWEAFLAGLAAVLAGGVPAVVAALGAEFVAKLIGDWASDKLATALRGLFDPDLAPRLLMTVFGAHLTYRPVVFAGDDIVFEHVAPLEPDPRPRENYHEAIGRDFVDLGVGGIRFTPQSLGDTWAAGNLAKIDHIVVVMMENRSYDHVLGHRSPGDGADGLTPEIIAAIEGADGGHEVRLLSEANFAPNDVGKMTRIPRGVGHDLADVRQQLSGRSPGPNGTEINDPKGFVDNFAAKLQEDPGPLGLVPDDVLGYYMGSDLPFFRHLAEQYAYCDHYFCSHPGPTLPNRMYSLTGDVQYDRLGVPILDNNHGDNFLLSRALTIYDALTKLGVSWRVYESNPSITMLRMFARYATNNTDIRRFERFLPDAANGDLPSFTVVEPAMHHHPENDDHPDADMWRGQIFLKQVYDALRLNTERWAKTLLIITYDEHGGLYDHRIPPVADLLRAPTAGGAVGGVGSVLAGEPIGSPGGGHGHGHGGGIAVDVGGSAATTGTEPAPPATPQLSLPIIYGVRVPTFVVSPWVASGKGPEIVLDHCSILKTVLARFAGGARPFLSDRVAASHTFDAYLTEPQPRADIPGSPELAALPIEAPRLGPAGSAIVTPPLSRAEMREGPVDYHVLTGRLARMLGR